MILGNFNKYEIVTDARVLNAFIKRGYIKKCEFDIPFPQVDSNDFKYNIFGFKYKNNKYEIKYFEGSIFPFVCKVNNNYK